MKSLYRVHGLLIESEIDLPELSPCRAEQGDILLADVCIRRGAVAEPQPPSSVGEHYVRVGDAATLVNAPQVGRILVENGSTIVVDVKPDTDPALLRLLLLGSAIGIICHQRGLMVLHASAVAFGDKVVAFAGIPGAGKSTLAAYCVAAGARLVADDLLAVSLPEDGRALAHPGMPRMKLWHDALQRLGHSTQGLVPDWWRAEKFHFPCDRPLTGGPMGLARFCVLGDDEHASDGVITQLKGAAALASVVTHTYRVEFLDSLSRRDRHFTDCARLAASTDIVLLSRQRDPQRLHATAALVAASVAD